MNKKNGMSLIVLVVITIVMIILVTTTVTISVSSMQKATKTTFANDLAEIQSAVLEYYATNGALPTTNVTLSGSSWLSLLTSTQQTKLKNVFVECGEVASVSDTSGINALNFYVVDLSKINVKTTERGNGSTADGNVYVVNEMGSRVYYVKSVTVSNQIYFALTNELSEVTNVKVPTNTTSDVISSTGSDVNAIKLTKDKKVWSNSITINIETTSGEAIKVKLGDSASTTTITSTGTVNNGIWTGKYTIGSAQRSALSSNKIVTVTRGSATSVIRVDNFDATVPTVISQAVNSSSATNDSYNEIIVTATDPILNGKAESGIKEVRYEYIKKYTGDYANPVDYYQDTVTDDSIWLVDNGKKSDLTLRLPKDVQLIQYVVVDNAGNVSSMVTYQIPEAYLQIRNNPVEFSWTNFYSLCLTYTGQTTGYNYNNPVIPPGFRPIDVGEAIWGELSSGSWNKGLVIEDAKRRQFVWVPCTIDKIDGIIVFANTTTTSGRPPNIVVTNSEGYDTVQKYGGFYIQNNENGLSLLSYSEALQSAKWNHLAGDQVYSTLISDAMWNTTCNWLNVTLGVEIENDSATWGCYSGNINAVGMVTFSKEYSSYNNITGIAGYYAEWVLGGNIRGGGYAINNSTYGFLAAKYAMASIRGDTETTRAKYRVALYIK